MLYQTISLELIQDQPALCAPLQATRTLQAKVEATALDLMARHEAWIARIAEAKPARHPSQVSSEALELAIEELRADLLCESAATEGDSPLSLDEAMSFIRTRTPVA